MTLHSFTLGSSVISTLPTLIYVGLAHRKNRISILNNPSNIDNIESYLSIPFEFLIVGILVAYGITYSMIERNIKKNGKKNKTKVIVSHGILLGLTLSLIGRFIFDLPVKMFNISRDKSWIVHPIAMVLYPIIMLYVDHIFGSYIN